MFCSSQITYGHARYFTYNAGAGLVFLRGGSKPKPQKLSKFNAKKRLLYQNFALYPFMMVSTVPETLNYSH